MKFLILLTLLPFILSQRCEGTFHLDASKCETGKKCCNNYGYCASSFDDCMPGTEIGEDDDKNQSSMSICERYLDYCYYCCMETADGLYECDTDECRAAMESDLPVGTVVGVCLGVVYGCILVCILGYCCYLNKSIEGEKQKILQISLEFDKKRQR